MRPCTYQSSPSILASSGSSRPAWNSNGPLFAVATLQVYLHICQLNPRRINVRLLLTMCFVPKGDLQRVSRRRPRAYDAVGLYPWRASRISGLAQRKWNDTSLAVFPAMYHILE